MKESELTTVRRRYAAKIAKMTPVEAKKNLDKIHQEGITIEHPTIRDLTGGYCSQSLNAAVIRRLYEQSKK